MSDVKRAKRNEHVMVGHGEDAYCRKCRNGVKTCAEHKCGGPNWAPKNK